MKVKSIVLLIVCVFFAAPPIFSINLESFSWIKEYGGSVGSSFFSHDFQSGLSAQVFVESEVKNNISIFSGLGYRFSKSTTSYINDLVNIPFQLGAKYYFSSDNEWKPYFGGFALLDLNQSRFNSFLFGYGIKGGTRYQYSNTSVFFIEAVKSFCYYPKKELNIDPYQINIGISFKVDTLGAKTKQIRNAPKKVKKIIEFNSDGPIKGDRLKKRVIRNNQFIQKEQF